MNRETPDVGCAVECETEIADQDRADCSRYVELTACIESAPYGRGLIARRFELSDGVGGAFRRKREEQTFAKALDHMATRAVYGRSHNAIRSARDVERRGVTTGSDGHGRARHLCEGNN